MIQSRYEDKKEAQQLAASYLSDSIQFSINKKVKEKSTELSKQIDALLREYDKKQNFNQNIKLDFDSKSIFMGAVAGLSTFGALATWASIVAAGSNLGAYLLVPTVVSFLSSIGISVGGTAAAASIVAALGGPITIGIGIAVVMGGIFAWLTGSSWQKKIAKRLVDLFEKENFETKLVDGISTYWNDTSKAFEIAADKTEKKFQDEISNLENSINTVDDDTLKEHKDYYTALSFFIKNLTANL
jgi:Flp pilus assembly protein TadB